MTPIPKFGFSAFLKLLHSNPRPQLSIIRGRCAPSSGGYDYHKSLRQRVQRIAFDGLTSEEALSSTADITSAPERNSARRALERLFIWREQNPGVLEPAPAVVFDSPSGLYRLEYKPDFMAVIGGRRTAVHVWNTARPLSSTITTAALWAVATRYPVHDRPDDFGVLSLQDGTLFCRSQGDRQNGELGERLLGLIDNLFISVRRETESHVDRGEFPMVPPA